jgi:Trk K+ transport system NAD-binding subunit
LDPRIVHSFRIGTHLMVVSVFEARQGLPGLTISEVRDRFGGLALSMRRGGKGDELLHPSGDTRIAAGDVVTLQAEYKDYKMLRAFTMESEAPVYSHHGDS